LDAPIAVPDCRNLQTVRYLNPQLMSNTCEHLTFISRFQMHLHLRPHASISQPITLHDELLSWQQAIPALTSTSTSVSSFLPSGQTGHSTRRASVSGTCHRVWTNIHLHLHKQYHAITRAEQSYRSSLRVEQTLFYKTLSMHLSLQQPAGSLGLAPPLGDSYW
jgi:hypothetical protein